MDRMLVVVFDNERRAYEGEKQLLEFDSEGRIGVYAWAVVAKQANGKVTVKQEDDPGPLGTLLATSLGAVVGALGGPVAAAVGATAGASLGAGFDINNIRIGSVFLTDVAADLLTSRNAGVAGDDADATTPVHTAVAELVRLVV